MQIFSPYLWVAFNFLDSIFWSTKVLILMKSNVPIFSLVICAFGVISKGPLKNLKLWRITPVFFKEFIVLALTFRYLKLTSLFWNSYGITKDPEELRQLWKRSNLEDSHFPNSKFTIQARVIKKTLFWHKERHINQWNGV